MMGGETGSNRSPSSSHGLPSINMGQTPLRMKQYMIHLAIEIRMIFCECCVLWWWEWRSLWHANIIIVEIGIVFTKVVVWTGIIVTKSKGVAAIKSVAAVKSVGDSASKIWLEGARLREPEHELFSASEELLPSDWGEFACWPLCSALICLVQPALDQKFLLHFAQTNTFFNSEWQIVGRWGIFRELRKFKWSPKWSDQVPHIYCKNIT